jgi:hypothetical protein
LQIFSGKPDFAILISAQILMQQRILHLTILSPCLDTRAVYAKNPRSPTVEQTLPLGVNWLVIA